MMKDKDPLLLRRWAVVFTAFMIALTSWSIAFYGIGFYLLELTGTRGWSLPAVSGQITLYYVGSAALIFFAGDAFQRFGARPVTVAAIALLALGLVAVGRVREPWQLTGALALLAGGWAFTSGAAINAIVAPWFEARRGLALSLALTGASAAGMVSAPLFVHLGQVVGFARSTLLLAVAAVLLLIPLVLVTLAPARQDARARDTGAAGTAERRIARRRDLLRSPRFWTMAAPFAFGLVAQVGFLTHQLSYLTPLLGAAAAAKLVSLTAFSAVTGRLLTGLVVDRLDRRLGACANFLVQSCGMLFLLGGSGGLGFGIPADIPAEIPWPILVGCLLFGFGVGNMITFPSLIAQQEFASGDFARVVSLTVAIYQFAFAFGPGLLGWLVSYGGSYVGALWLCLGLQLLGAMLVVQRPRERATLD